MKGDDAKFQELIGLIYEAAVEPELWPELLDQLSVYADLNEMSERLPAIKSKNLSKSRATLTDHFKRAARLSKKVSKLSTSLDASTSVLDRLPIGVMFAESGGKVAFVNQRARSILDGNDSLSLKNSCLETSSLEVTRNIYQCIDEMLASTSKPGKAITIAQDSSIPLSISISPLASLKWFQPSENQYALILIATPNSPSHITQQNLIDRYGLTPAEAKFALAFIDNNGMEEAAEKVFISKHTARTHLKSLFAKVGVNRQSELVKHLLTSPEALIADSARAAITPITQDKPWHTMPKLSRYIRLYDGRRLGFAEYGDPEGVPVIVNHGASASRLQMHPDENIAIRAGVRLIVPDRPGMGFSDFQENRRVMDWSDDIKQLADQLKIERFAMIGLTTGGGHWTLQCAFKIPDRLSAVSLVSTRITVTLLQAAPSIRPLLGMARLAPSMFYQYLKIMGSNVKKNPESYLERRMPDHAEVDQLFLQSPAGKKLFVEPLVEALREGPRGIAWDISISMQEWGFDIEEVLYPIKMWHGTDDMIVPMEETELAAKLLPNCKTVFIENEGQYLFMNHWKEILDDIVQRHNCAH